MTILRNRAWRRFKARLNKGCASKNSSNSSSEKREKNWKLLYFRKNKLARAKQLGFEYPVKSERQLLDPVHQGIPL